MNRLIFLLVLVVASSTAVAAPTSAPVRAEIDVLLTNLQASGCEFGRNGAWYSGAEAKIHLLRKLEYLEGKSTLRSTEQFIELAASSSSFTGQSYQVKCGNTPPVKSQQWLTRELASIRSLSSGGKP